MTEPVREPDDPLATARQLGESLAALIGNTDWQIDEVPDAQPPEALPVDDDPPAVIPFARPVDPPLAEAVNETAVPPTPVQIIEALLFVGGPPLNAADAAEAIRGLGQEQFDEIIELLNRTYRIQRRPYTIVHEQAGHVLRVLPRFASIREKLFGGPREARLNQTALDVLALVAYRQPVTKSEIDSSRGLDSGGTLRQLVRLGLVVSTSRPGEQTTYETTARFLEVFHVADLDDLPRMGELQRI